MGVKAGLLKAYFALEGVYYKAMDALEAVKIPAYRVFVNPIESRGIPSFPVFALVLLALLAGGLFLATRSATLVVVVKEGNATVDGALVMVAWDGITVNYALTDENGSASFPVPVGKVVIVDVEKGGKFKRQQLTPGGGESKVTIKIG